MQDNQNQQNPSEVEQFYNLLASKFGSRATFKELSPIEVQKLIQGVNLILSVLK